MSGAFKPSGGTIPTAHSGLNEGLQIIVKVDRNKMNFWYDDENHYHQKKAMQSGWCELPLQVMHGSVMSNPGDFFGFIRAEICLSEFTIEGWQRITTKVIFAHICASLI